MVVGSDGLVVPRCGLWWFFRGGTGSWLLDVYLSLGLRGGVFPLMECARLEGTGSWLLAPLFLARLTMLMQNT